MDTPPPDLARLTSILGTQRRVAEVFELTEDQVSRIARGKSPTPAYMQVVVELLDRLPPERWPERFTKR